MPDDRNEFQFAPSVDTLRQFLPYYLTGEQQNRLAKELSDFDSNKPFYILNTTLYQDELLQGDGWTKLMVANLETGDRKSIQGLLLSNSCDISPENKRDLPTSVTFAPIVEVDQLKSWLAASQLEPNKIDNKLRDIRDQNVSSIFYLPPGGPFTKEHVALLGQVHSMPIKMFQAALGRTKLFTLDTLGFYVFIVKLSIHFCRLREHVNRA
jgi:hypothetical protein